MPERSLRGPRPAGWCRLFFALGALLAAFAVGTACASEARSCVWRVTDQNGHSLYLAGSIHALRPSDYPFPKPYEQAYAASSLVAFETDLTLGANEWKKAMGLAALYPMNGKLKDHVDPRTYAYILRVVGNTHGSAEPEKRIEHFRPWAIAFMLESPGGIQGVSTRYGVEPYFIQKAKHDHKPMVGLVPFNEHIAVFGKMNDADSEAVLLLAFIHLNTGGKMFARMVDDWKRGDIDAVEKMEEDEYSDAPSVRKRMLTDRNQRWVPKLEGYLRSGKTCMAIVGTAHMAGERGLPALLRARGYQVEQL